MRVVYLHVCVIKEVPIVWVNNDAYVYLAHLLSERLENLIILTDFCWNRPYNNFKVKVNMKIFFVSFKGFYLTRTVEKMCLLLFISRLFPTNCCPVCVGEEKCVLLLSPLTNAEFRYIKCSSCSAISTAMTRKEHLPVTYQQKWEQRILFSLAFIAFQIQSFNTS